MTDPTHDLGDRIEMLFTLVEDFAILHSPDDDTHLRTVKLYASSFARFALARAEANLFRSGNFSAARAVAAQGAVLEALEKGL